MARILSYWSGFKKNGIIILYSFFLPTYSFSELPECHVPLAMRKDVIDQILEIAMHPGYRCMVAVMSVGIIVNLAHSPETHPYIITREIAEKLLKVYDQRQKMILIQQPIVTQKGREEDTMVVSVLKYVVVVKTLPHTIILHQQ